MEFLYHAFLLMTWNLFYVQIQCYFLFLVFLLDVSQKNDCAVLFYVCTTLVFFLRLCVRTKQKCLPVFIERPFLVEPYNGLFSNVNTRL
jgi:hypothetical protein